MCTLRTKGPLGENLYQVFYGRPRAILLLAFIVLTFQDTEDRKSGFAVVIKEYDLKLGIADIHFQLLDVTCEQVERGIAS